MQASIVFSSPTTGAEHTGKMAAMQDGAGEDQGYLLKASKNVASSLEHCRYSQQALSTLDTQFSSKSLASSCSDLKCIDAKEQLAHSPHA